MDEILKLENELNSLPPTSPAPLSALLRALQHILKLDNALQHIPEILNLLFNLEFYRNTQKMRDDDPSIRSLYLNIVTHASKFVIYQHASTLSPTQSRVQLLTTFHKYFPQFKLLGSSPDPLHLLFLDDLSPQEIQNHKEIGKECLRLITTSEEDAGNSILNLSEQRDNLNELLDSYVAQCPDEWRKN